MPSLSVSPSQEEAGKRRNYNPYPSIKSACPVLPRTLLLEGEDEWGNETQEHFVALPMLQGDVHRRRTLRRGYSTLQTINGLVNHGTCFGYDLFRVASRRDIWIGSIAWIEGMWERIVLHCPEGSNVSCLIQTGDRFSQDQIDEAVLCCLENRRNPLEQWLEESVHAA